MPPLVLPTTSAEPTFDQAFAPVWNRSARILLTGIENWHLLSLDAPTVAMLWTWFLAKANHISLPPAAIAAMGIAVWMLYATDRLLDSRLVPTPGLVEPNHRELEPRHVFHRLHQRSFLIGILAASVALALLLPELAPQSIHLYFVLGTLLLGYFTLIHAHPSPALVQSCDSDELQAKTHRMPKEIAVGIFFSAATFIPTVARAPALRLTLLPGALLFAVLCSLNCLFIYTWEHPLPSPRTHAATRIALRFLPHLAVAALLGGLALTFLDRPLSWPIPTACALATSLLLLLDQTRYRTARHLSPTTLRAAADLSLLTPILFLPFLPR